MIIKVTLPAHVVYVHDLRPPSATEAKQRQWTMIKEEDPLAAQDVDRAQKVWAPTPDVEIIASWRGGARDGSDTAVAASDGVLHLHPPDVVEKDQVHIKFRVARETGSLTTTYIPRFRRVCLSLPGEHAAEHYIVSHDSEEPLIVSMPGLKLAGDESTLRLLSIGPAFHFKMRRSQRRKRKHGGNDNDATDKAIDLDVKDPWADTVHDAVARDSKTGKHGPIPLYFEVFEEDTQVTLGTMWPYDGYKTGRMTGLTHMGNTGTGALARIYETQLGRARSLLLRALNGVEGHCEALNSYDKGRLSWGILQWTAGSGPYFQGELAQILAFIHHFYPRTFERCFALYGLRVYYSRVVNEWSAHGTYRDAIVYRVPCCGPRTRAFMDEPRRDKRSKIEPLQPASFAMHWVLAQAGTDAGIQQAQTRWYSFRLTTLLHKDDTVKTAADRFLRHLGSNESPQKRLERAMSNVSAKEQNMTMDDASGLETWRSWPAALTERNNAEESSTEPPPSDRGIQFLIDDLNDSASKQPANHGSAQFFMEDLNTEGRS